MPRGVYPRKKRDPLPPELWVHGTRSTYGYRGCRCDYCTAAQLEYTRELWRKKGGKPRVYGPRAIKHGTINSYRAHKCRCEKCRVAMAAHYRKERDRKKASDPKYSRTLTHAEVAERRLTRRMEDEISGEDKHGPIEALDFTNPYARVNDAVVNDTEDWIRQMLRSGQTIWATHTPPDGGDVSVERYLDTYLEGKMQSNESFRKNVLHWKGVVKRDTRTRNRSDRGNARKALGEAG